MKTSDLINALSNDPVKAMCLEAPGRRFFKWMVVSIVIIFLCILFVGIRNDLPEKLLMTDYLIQILLTLALIMSAGLSAFYLSVPDLQSKKVRYLPGLFIALWGIFLSLSLLFTSNLSFSFGLSCVRDIFFLSLAPGVISYKMINKAAPLDRALSGFFCAIASLGLGALGTQLICINDEYFHILLWHYFPVLLLGIVGIFLGYKFFKKT